MHIHLDPVGGVAGDMFIAAMLDTFPELETGMVAAIRAAGLPGALVLGVEDYKDGVLTGKRFQVGDKGVLAHHDHHHRHVSFREIRALLSAPSLDAKTKRAANAIFALLAEAEASVHGIPADAVEFHELGGWDSIADIVGAAYLIEHGEASSWSIGSLPKGAGVIRTAHGDLPVPAPATARLLEGFELHDDGREGERITPTGAAIVRHLKCAQDPSLRPRKLKCSGYGFGSRRFPGISNVLRVLAFSAPRPAADWTTETVAVVEFEVDDQTPEDLATGLARVQEVQGVLDIVQFAGTGKKGRIAIRVQVLADPAALDEVLAACLDQTTTLGARYHLTSRAVLERRAASVQVDACTIRAKVARRGVAATIKPENDDVARNATTATERQALRSAVEAKFHADE